jgi:hypothetical protein
MTHVSRRGVLAAFGSALGGATFRRQAAAADSDTFGAWLTGGHERPPVETDALGFAVFRVGPAERRIDYWLVVSGIENVEESHVHKGPPDLNGNVVAYLFGPAPRPVSKTGLLASGTLTDGDMVWPLTSAAEMAAQMRAENVYVNVHTTEHPSGEIRGQIRPVSETVE